MQKLLALIALLSASSIQAQDKPPTVPSLPDIGADLSALNAHFNGIATFRVDRDDRLITEYIDNGMAYRVDQAYLEFLDPATVTFNVEERTVMVKCTDAILPTGQANGKCIDKEVKKTGAISQTGRMNLPVPGGDASGAKAIALLSKLLNDAQRIQQSQADETNPGRKRKN